MFRSTETPPSQASTASTNPSSDLEILQAALKKHYQLSQVATSNPKNLPLILLRHDIVEKREEKLKQSKGAAAITFTAKEPVVVASRQDHKRWLKLYDDLYSSEDTVALQDLFSNCRQGNKRVLIFGDTGAGKSTIAREIASALGGKKSFILISAKHLKSFLAKQQQKKSLATSIHQLFLDPEDKKAITPRKISTLIENHKEDFCIVFDGYERIAHLDNKEKSENIREIIDEILSFPQLIVTGHRENAFNLTTGEFRKPFDDAFDIMGFTRDTVFEYIENSLQSPRSKLSQNLTRILNDSPNLLRMLRTPLILQLFCNEVLSLTSPLINYSEDQLTVKLFTRLTEKMLHQAHKVLEQPQQMCDEKILREAVLRVMEKLAYEAMESNKIYITNDKMDNILFDVAIWVATQDKESKAQYPVQTRFESDLTEVLRAALSCVGFVRSKQHSAIDVYYYFLDLTIQQWFAACHLAREQGKGIIYSKNSPEVSTKKKPKKIFKKVGSIVRKKSSELSSRRFKKVVEEKTPVASSTRVSQLYAALLLEQQQTSPKFSRRSVRATVNQPHVSQQRVPTPTSVKEVELVPDPKGKTKEYISENSEPPVITKEVAKPVSLEENLLEHTQNAVKALIAEHKSTISDFSEPVVLRKANVRKRERQLSQDIGDFKRWEKTFKNLSSGDNTISLPEIVAHCQQSEMSSSGNVLLFGDTGIGKATLLRKIAFGWHSSSESTKKIKLLFLISFKQVLRSHVLKQGDDINLLTIATIIHKLCLHPSYAKEIKPEQIKTLLETYENDCLFLLYRYDAISKLDNGLSFISRLLDELLSYRVIVAAHPSFSNINKLLDHQGRKPFNAVLTIMGFAEDKIKEYIENYCQTLLAGEPLSDNKEPLAENLWNFFQANPSLLSAAYNPFMLQFMCNQLCSYGRNDFEIVSATFGAEVSVSQTVTLLEKLTNTILSNIEQKQLMKQELFATEETFRQAMQLAMERLAFHAMTQNKIYLQQTSSLKKSYETSIISNILEKIAEDIINQNGLKRKFEEPKNSISLVAHHLYQSLIQSGLVREMQKQNHNQIISQQSQQSYFKESCYFTCWSFQQWFAACHLHRLSIDSPTVFSSNVTKYGSISSFKNVFAWCQELSSREAQKTAKEAKVEAVEPSSVSTTTRNRRHSIFRSRRKETDEKGKKESSGQQTPKTPKKRRFALRRKSSRG